MSNVHRYFLNLKLRNRIMLFYILFILIPLIVVGIAIYLSISGTLVEYMMQGNLSSLDQSAQAIENKIRGMENTLNIVAMDKRTNAMLTSITLDNYPDIGSQAADHITIVNMFMSLQRIGRLFKLRIYLPSSFYYASENDQFSTLKDLEQETWFQALARGDKAFAYYMDSYEDYARVRRDVFCAVRLVRDPTDFSRYIAAVSAESIVGDIASELPSIEAGGLAFLYSDAGQFIARSREDAQPWEQLAGSLSDGRWLNVKDNAGNGGYAFSRKLGATGWKLVFVMPTSELFHIRDQRMILLIAGFAILTMATVGFAYFVASMSTKRLGKLIANMRRVQSGDFDITIENDGLDEIGEITSKFNTMVFELRELLKNRQELNKRIEQTEVAAVRAKIKALQSQIKPHFLYNTLDSILWKAMYNDIPKVEKLVQSLAEFYRLTLSNGSDIVTVDHEIRHVTSYVAIQNIRFDGNIRFVANVDDIDRYLLPNITLQPLVENALLHGLIEHGEKSGLIRVTGSHTDSGTIRLSIEDDGAGMPQELVDRFNAMAPGGAGLGIANVGERIRLYFGSQYGLSFASAPGKGTTIVMEIPGITDPGWFNMNGPADQDQ